MVLTNTTTLKDFPSRYLQVINGLFGLTLKELNVMAAIAAKELELSEGIIDKNLLYKILFSVDVRKELASGLGMTHQALTALIRGIQKKGAIYEEDGTLRTLAICLPSETITFKFVIDETEGETEDVQDMGERSEGTQPIDDSSGDDPQDDDEESS